MVGKQDSAKPIIVVGGGLAGLASATYLARGGRAVTLLEKAATLGGRATTDYRGGFALNRGAHALYSGGPMSDVLGELGVAYRAGIPRHVLARDARGLHRFPTTPLQLLRSRWLDGGDKREIAAFFVRLAVVSPAAHAHQSMAAWIAEVVRRPVPRRLVTTLARVQAYSSALDEISAGLMLARLQQSSKHPVQYVSGGWQTLVDGLRGAAVRAGVDVRPGSSVERIDTAGGVATGVRLRGGSYVAADHVVLAVAPGDAGRLLGEAAAPRLARLLATTIPGDVAALDVALRALPSRANAVVFDLDHARFVTVQSPVADLAPAGGAVVHAFTQPDHRVAANPTADRAMLEGLLDETQPGWRDLVVEARFLPRMSASSTLPLLNRAGDIGRAAHRSEDLPNVFFAGDWVGPRGYLADASLASARETARLLLAATTPRAALRLAA